MIIRGWRGWAGAPGVVLLAGTMLACSSGSGELIPPASSRGGPRNTAPMNACASIAYFEGRAYVGMGVRIAPVEGDLLGTAILPGCDDGGGQESPPPDEVIQVAALPGVAPDVALVWHGVTDRVLVRDDTGPLPPELQQLLRTPSCDPDDAPIELDGPWLGIHDGDQTELDLLPPYQVDLQVVRASSPRYERAFLTVEVPAGLGAPLSQEDVETSLWKGGSISVRARCSGSGFVAESVEASPPA